jgi:type II secretory ATPase GspE/PulE/Tfp pilus assembly ATPase PilB-like protein
MVDIQQIDFKTLLLLSAEQAHKYRVIPAGQEGAVVAFFHPEGRPILQQELEFLLGKKVQLLPVSGDLFDRQLARYYPIQVANAARTRPELREDSDVIRFVRKFMEDAVSIGASDIHIERYESFARIRFRWEGQLIEKFEVPLSQYNAVVSRIKILSELDISERRLPQDGRIHLTAHGQKIDIRVSTLPAQFGEKIVLRLLTRSPAFLQLDNLGMKPDELERFNTALQAPNGIVLITGPTGSGKTTTLYAALNLLNRPHSNISTVEDPIEYNIEGINQVQVKEEIGMTFGNALRAFLRQDPNIIMVGEIRDRETAEIAIRAALVGRLVFSTLHTNSSWDAVTRLIDMGVEPYLLAASLRMVVAQRLLRRLCDTCKRPISVQTHAKLLDTYQISTCHEPVGCPECHYTGYAKRKAIYEVVPITRYLTDKIKSLDLDIDAYLRQEGILTLRDQVVALIRDGETSLEEGLMYLIG